MEYLFLALTNPVEGQEPAFNRWYDAHHVPEVVRYGRGFTGGRRYRLDAPGSGPASRWQYVALYDMESVDLAAYHQSPWLEPRPPLTPFTGLLRDNHVAWVFAPRGPWMSADDVRAEDGDVALRRCERLLFVWDDRDAAIPSGTIARRYAIAEHQRAGQPPPPSTQLTLHASSGSSTADWQPGGADVWRWTPVSEYFAGSRPPTGAVIGIDV